MDTLYKYAKDHNYNSIVEQFDSINFKTATLKDLSQVYFNSFDHEYYPFVKETIRHIPHILKVKKYNQISSLSLAIFSKNIDIVKFILDNGDTEFYYDAKSVIHEAVNTGNIEIVDLLIEFGADPMIYENDKNFSQEFKVYDCLTKTYKQNNFLSNQNLKNPLLFKAVNSENIEMVKKVLELGIDINNETVSMVHGSKTKIHNAFDSAIGTLCLDSKINDNKIKIAKFLIDKGIYINENHLLKLIKKKNNDLLELIQCIINKYPTLLIPLHEYKIIENIDFYCNISILLKTNVDFCDAHKFAYLGDFKKLKSLNRNLFDIGYDKNEVTNIISMEKFIYKSMTPLTIAIYKKHSFIIELIEFFNLEINCEHIEYAILSGNLILTEYLINNVKKKTNYVRPLYDAFNSFKASKQNYPKIEMIQLLSKYEGYLTKKLIIQYIKFDINIFNFLLGFFNSNNIFEEIDSFYFDSCLFYSDLDIVEIIKIMINYNFDFNKKNEQQLSFIDKNLFDYCLVPKKNTFKIFEYLMLNYDLNYRTSKLQDFILQMEKRLIDIKKHNRIYVAKSPHEKSTANSIELLEEHLPILKNIYDIMNVEICSICFDFKPIFIGKKCNHKVLCLECSTKVNKCPQCTLSLV